MKKRKLLFKIIAFAFCTILLLPPFSAYAKTELPFPSVTDAKSVYLYHFESDTILINKSSTDKQAPASTVKIMSGLVAIELLKNRLDEQVTVTDAMLSATEGYTVKLEVGNTLTIRNLLYCLICGGGNDAANILAIVASGSIDTFVSQMNAKAEALGMSDTYYKNPTGIDDNEMTTSISDTAIISKEAIKDKLFMEMCGAKSYTFTMSNGEERTINNRNGLLNKKIKGLNSGMTDKGGYCSSTYATDGNNSYLCIVMGGTETTDGKTSSYKITNSLLNYAYDNYTYTLIAEKGDIIGATDVEFALPTSGSDTVQVKCVLNDDIYAYVPANINYKTKLTYKPYFYEASLSAPVEKNTVVGGVDIYYNDSYIASGILVTRDDIKESKLLLVINGMKLFFVSRGVIIFVILMTISLCSYFYITAWRKKLKVYFYRKNGRK